MDKKYLVALLISFFVFFQYLGAQTVISGVVTNGVGEVISLSVIDDFITHTELKIDEAVIEKDGSFTLRARFNDIRYAKISIGYSSAAIFLEPDENYQLDVEYKKPNSFDNPNLREIPLYYSIKNEVFEGLNKNINAFNLLYDEFVMNHFVEVFRSRNKALINTFIDEVDKTFAGYDNPFFRTYVRYRIASIEYQSRTKNKTAIAAEYLTGRPLYQNNEMMSFFNLYFDKYIISESKFITREDLQSTINYQVSYEALLDTLGKDTILINEAMRELVMLKTLKSMYYDDDYGQKQVLYIINNIAAKSKVAENKKIALNILDKFDRLQPGTKAPGIIIGEQNLLASQGKPYILIDFFQTWNGACQAEMLLLKELNVDYSDSLYVINISTDAKKADFLTWKAGYESPDNWHSVWFGDDYSLLTEYRVKSYPLFVLLDSDGKIVQWNIPRPSEGMKLYFQRLFK